MRKQRPSYGLPRHMDGEFHSGLNKFIRRAQRTATEEGLVGPRCEICTDHYTTEDGQALSAWYSVRAGWQVGGPVFCIKISLLAQRLPLLERYLNME